MRTRSARAKSLSGVSGNAVLSQPIMSNAGQISDFTYFLQQPDTVNIAQAFTTGGNPSGYSLSGLRFGIKIDTAVDALSWALYADAAGEPAAASAFTEIAVPSDSLDGIQQILLRIWSIPVSRWRRTPNTGRC